MRKFAFAFYFLWILAGCKSTAGGSDLASSETQIESNRPSFVNQKKASESIAIINLLFGEGIEN